MGVDAVRSNEKIAVFDGAIAEGDFDPVGGGRSPVDFGAEANVGLLAYQIAALSADNLGEVELQQS